MPERDADGRGDHQRRRGQHGGVHGALARRGARTPGGCRGATRRNRGAGRAPSQRRNCADHARSSSSAAARARAPEGRIDPSSSSVTSPGAASVRSSAADGDDDHEQQREHATRGAGKRASVIDRVTAQDGRRQSPACRRSTAAGGRVSAGRQVHQPRAGAVYTRGAAK